jgi:hypothetical protein
MQILWITIPTMKRFISWLFWMIAVLLVLQITASTGAEPTSIHPPEQPVSTDTVPDPQEQPLPTVTLTNEDENPHNQPLLEEMGIQQHLSYANCVALVMNVSTSVALARVEVALQENTLQQQKPRLRPKLSLVMSNQQSVPLATPETISVPTTPQAPPSVSFATTSRLNSQITVWDFGQSAYLYEKTKRSLIKTKLTEAETIRLVKETVLQAYVDALKAQYQWQYAKETCLNLTEKQAVLQLLYNTQSAVVVEGETLALQLQQTTDALAQQQTVTEQARTVYQARLTRLGQLTLKHYWAAQTTLEALTVVDAQYQQALSSANLTQRPAYIALSQAILEKERDYAWLKRERWQPKLEAAGSVVFAGTDANSPLSAYQRIRAQKATASLNLTVPIIATGNTKMQQQQALLEQQKLLLQRQQWLEEQTTQQRQQQQLLEQITQNKQQISQQLQTLTSQQIRTQQNTLEGIVQRQSVLEIAQRLRLLAIDEAFLKQLLLLEYEASSGYKVNTN